MELKIKTLPLKNKKPLNNLGGFFFYIFSSSHQLNKILIPFSSTSSVTANDNLK